jgi:transposase InsO family protein
VQQASRGAADAPRQSACAPRVPDAAPGGREAIGAHSQSAAATIHCEAAQHHRVTDITYIRTWQGWLYLAVVMDLFSRMIVAWAVTATIHRELVLNAT